MTGGILAGFVTSFARQQSSFQQRLCWSPATMMRRLPMAFTSSCRLLRDVALALGIVAVIVVAIGTVASQIIIERDKKLKESGD